MSVRVPISMDSYIYELMSINVPISMVGKWMNIKFPVSMVYNELSIKVPASIVSYIYKFIIYLYG